MGPAPAYPPLRPPALICFSEPNELFVPGLVGDTSAGFAFPDSACTERSAPNWAAARVMAAVPRKRRRSCLIGSDIYSPVSLLNEFKQLLVQRFGNRRPTSLLHSFPGNVRTIYVSKYWLKHRHPETSGG